MKTAKRLLVLWAALLLLFVPAFAENAGASNADIAPSNTDDADHPVRVFPSQEGSFLLLHADGITSVIGRGGEAAIRRLGEANGLYTIERVLILCDHPTHVESANAMAELLGVAAESADIPIRIDTDTETYIIGTDTIESGCICYGCDGKLMSDPPSEIRQYVMNLNTHKFHLPTCDSVKQMKEKNRRTYEGRRQDLIDRGYQPCKRCSP